jgi:hypothetical protein
MKRHSNSSFSVSLSSFLAMRLRSSGGVPFSATASMGTPGSHVVTSTRRVDSSGTTAGTSKSGSSATSALYRFCASASRK